MLKKFQDMGKLLKQAQEMKGAMKKVQEELRKTIIPISELEGKIKVQINGELEVISVDIDPSLLNPESKDALQNGVKKAFSIGIKKAKDIATTKLSAVSGGLLPG
ncbi:YbaB/EbfC family nucleoid-associated protein [bacterium]|jgi:nucleoid-associated protein EbfC|nr:YbaB/EbfC family nucleoid-associated protein [bacterium]